MAIDWFDVFDRLEQTAVGQAIRESLWYFPAVEAVHLLGLALLGGALLVVDLRLLGLGFRTQSTAAVARAARPWLLLALALMFVTGIPLFLSEAIKCYYNTSFWVKMSALLAGLVFTFAVRNRVAMAPRAGTAVKATAGVVNLGVWVVVAAAGRWIGFS